MSHRVYLYNIGTPAKADATDRLILESGYCMPPLLLPLLAGGGRVAANIYNSHGGTPHAGLYFDTRAGIDSLRRFYALLARHDGMVQDQGNFDEANRQLFGYLDSLEHPWLHLDMWDVFNMSYVDDKTRPHEIQAQEELAKIQRLNTLIDEAVQADDPSLLEGAEAADLRLGLPTFPALLNDTSHRYGWGYLQASEQAYDNTPEPFEENGSWGLRTPQGHTLAPAQFDAVYGIGPQDMAVVMKDDKFGYLNSLGALVIPLIWDDAYDFSHARRAIVARGGKSGLIDTRGELAAPAIYDDIEETDHYRNYSVCQDGRWGILNAAGGTIIACGHPTPIEQPYANIFLLPAPADGAPQALHGRRAGLLAEGFDELIRSDCLNIPVLRKGDRYGALGVEQERLLLPLIYDELTPLPSKVERRSGDFIRVRQGNLRGIYDGAPDRAGWVFPLAAYDDITWIYEHIFAVQRGGRWRLATSPNHELHNMEFDLVATRLAMGGFAYGFIGKEVWMIDEEEIFPADLDTVEFGLQNKYAPPLSKEARKRMKAYVKAATT